MNKKIILLIASSVLFIRTSYGQYVVRNSGDSFIKCTEAGVTCGLGQYRGEYHGFKHALRDIDYKVGYGISFRYNFNNDYNSSSLHRALDKRLSIGIGMNKYQASSNKKDEFDIMGMDILDFNLMFEFNIMKYSSMVKAKMNGNRFVPYLNLGIGYTGFNTSVKNMLIENEGYRYYPNVIVGAGLKLAIFDGITLSGKLELKFTGTDDIDYNNSVSNNDMYYFMGLSVMFNIGELLSK